MWQLTKFFYIDVLDILLLNKMLLKLSSPVCFFFFEIHLLENPQRRTWLAPASRRAALARTPCTLKRDRGYQSPTPPAHLILLLAARAVAAITNLLSQMRTWLYVLITIPQTSAPGLQWDPRNTIPHQDQILPGPAAHWRHPVAPGRWN